jgi:hypothetical protein
MSLSVHPVYGAIYQDGEFVQRGAVLGLSVDARAVVIAPISGWVRVHPNTDVKPTIEVEITEQCDADHQPRSES